MVNELEIEAVTGREILDSRGNPTVEVDVFVVLSIFSLSASHFSFVLLAIIISVKTSLF